MALIVGDVGGTKTALTIMNEFGAGKEWTDSESFSSTSFSTLAELVQFYLQKSQKKATHACFAVPGPVLNGHAKTTNLSWQLDEKTLAQQLNLDSVKLVNDLEATAAAIPHLTENDYFGLQKGVRQSTGACAVLAPGTGLGEAFLIWNGKQHLAFPSEGGHASFAPQSEMEAELLAFLRPQYGHVSYERVCSGIGIQVLYDFLTATQRGTQSQNFAENLKLQNDRTPLILESAVAADSTNSRCTMALEMFTDILASEAGNMALKYLSTGGVVLAGGLPPRILNFLSGPRFAKSFRNKGRFSDFLSAIPVQVVVTKDTALKGAASLALVRKERHNI